MLVISAYKKAENEFLAIFHRGSAWSAKKNREKKIFSVILFENKIFQKVDGFSWIHPYIKFSYYRKNFFNDVEKIQKFETNYSLLTIF